MVAKTNTVASDWEPSSGSSRSWTVKKESDVVWFTTSESATASIEINQRNCVAQSLRFIIDIDGAWSCETDVDGYGAPKSHVLQPGENRLEIELSPAKKQEKVTVILRVFSTKQGQFRLKKTAEITVGDLGLKWRRRFVSVFVALFIAYFVLSIAQLLTDFGFISDILAAVSLAAAWFAIGLPNPAWLRRAVRLLALPKASWIVSGVVSVLMISMLGDFVAYKVQKSNFWSKVEAVSKNIDAQSAQDLRQLALDWPNRKEVWILLDYRTNSISRATGGNEGRLAVREFHRIFFDIADAFDGNDLVQPSAISKSVAPFCGNTDKTRLFPLKFISLFSPGLYTSALDPVRGELSIGCHFAATIVQKTPLPIETDCTKLSAHQRLIWPVLAEIRKIDDPAMTIHHAIVSNLFSDINDTIRKCAEPFETFGEFNVCSELSQVEATASVTRLASIQGAEDSHALQFAHAQWIWRLVGLRIPG